MKKTSLPPRPIFVSAAQIEMKFQQAIQLHQHGQLAQAKVMYESILQVQPRHAQSLHFLGVMAHQTRNLEPAIALISKAIAIDPGQPAFYCNLGNVQLQLKQCQEAVTSYERAISIKPDFADAHANLGAAFAELKRHEDALAGYDRAIAIQPSHPNAFYNRGSALLALDQVDAAITSFQKAISLQPGFASAHCSLGAAFLKQAKLDEAIDCCRKALSINPSLAEAHGNLASALLEQDKPGEAISWFATAIGLAESDMAKEGFVRCLRRIAFNDASPAFRALVVRAITEAWTRPSMLRVPAISLAKQSPGVKQCLERAVSAWPKRLSKAELFGDSDLEVVAEDPMLLCLLECIPIASVEFERFVTLTRKVLLDLAVNAEDLTLMEAEPQANVLTLCCAVARQCYVNEYVYAFSDGERAQAEALHLALSEKLTARASIPAHWLAVAATYASLGSLPMVETVVNQAWPVPLNELLKQQVSEPLLEKSYQADLPSITPIEDSVSLLVQTQYEENPYPRWFRTPAMIRPMAVDAYFSQKFPHSAFQPLGPKDDLDILIAGCGTGQQPIEAAQIFLGAKLLAVDLSLASLSYAKRKTVELGLTNIHYARADILELGSVGRTFDIIESVGVLHHLADPLVGWQVLQKMLRPGGLMRLGFYSEFARTNIVEARNYIHSKGYAATETDIRQCRQDLMSNQDAFSQVLSFRDFYGMSECRDLLFHVQEHRYTIPALKDAMNDFGLTFLGFTLESELLGQYVKKFPADRAGTNLDNWHVFETENPKSFAGMYQFWVQKAR